MSLTSQGFHEEEEVGEELMVTVVRRGPQSGSGAIAALTQQRLRGGDRMVGPHVLTREEEAIDLSPRSVG
jgi:hypothetical protein